MEWYGEPYDWMPLAVFEALVGLDIIRIDRAIDRVKYPSHCPARMDWNK